MALANLLWLVGVVLIVTAPPATAAMFALAGRALRREYITTGDFFAEAARLFWRSWVLAILSLGGVLIGLVDLLYYSRVVTGLPGTVGALLLFYLLLLWIQAQAYAWAQLALRPDLSPLRMERNGLMLAARYPGFSLFLLVILAGLLVLTAVLPLILGLALAALGALVCVHGLARVAPDLLPADDHARLLALEASDALPEPPRPSRAR